MHSSVLQTSTDTWHYQYEWVTGAADAKNLSHFLIEITPGSQLSEFFNFSTLPGDGVFTYVAGAQGQSEANLPGLLTGFKFSPAGDTTDFTVTFDSHHAPTYGDFYAQDGKSGGTSVYAYNVGFNGAVGPGGFLERSHSYHCSRWIVLARA